MADVKLLLFQRLQADRNEMQVFALFFIFTRRMI